MHLTSALVLTFAIAALGCARDEVPSPAFERARQRGSTPEREWRTYLGDRGVSHWSALDTIHRGNVAQHELAWSYDAGDLAAGLSQIQFNPLIAKGVLYGVSPSLRYFALDAASGQVVYKQRPSRARHRGSPLVADGKLYLMGMDGTVTVLRTGRKFELLAQNRLDEQLAASLAVGEGTLYLRTYDALYAIRNN